MFRTKAITTAPETQTEALSAPRRPVPVRVQLDGMA
jgi:hypothetical protein